MFVEVVLNGAMDYVLKNFAGDGNKGDWAIVLNFSFVTFFKDRDNPGLLPVVRD